MMKKNSQYLINLIVFLLLLLTSIGIPTGTASSASFNVSRFDDPIPGGCDPGDCSLREAILAANSSVGVDTIDLPAGTYSLSITGNGENGNLTGDLDISESVNDKWLGCGCYDYSCRWLG